MTYTSEQIELMDLWLLTIINGEYSINSVDTFAKKHDISLELSNWTYNNMVKIGHELSILRGYKSPSDKWKIIKVDRIACANFIKNGGFVDHFSDKPDTLNMTQNITVDQSINIDQSVKVDNQSRLSMGDNKLAIQKKSNKTEQIPSKRPWLEIISWICGIAITIIGVYEFITKILIN